MINLSSVSYSVKQGLKGLKRNRLFSLAAIGTITACLFLFGIFYFIIQNVQYNVKEMENNVVVSVFFQEGITEDRVKEIGTQIKRRTEVDHIDFISKEQAWEEFQKENWGDDNRIAETFGNDNPLKDSESYTVYLKDVSKQDILVSYVENLEGVRQVKRNDYSAKLFTNFNSLIGYVSAAIIILLVVVSIFLISTTVTMGITVRKEEIGMIKLLGATDMFIRAPFIVEGMVIGLIGAAVPLVGLYYIYNTVVEYIGNKFSDISRIMVFLNVSDVFQTLIPIAVCIGVGIGFIGSFITVRRHLKV